MVTREKIDYVGVFKFLNWDFLKECSEVMEIGLPKHGFESYKKYTKNDIKEIKKSLVRHIKDYLQGEKNDKDSGKSHLAHAKCNLMFLYYIDNLKVVE